MEKIRIGVICGGMSTENEVSIVSADSVLKNLDSCKYEVFPIYIDKEGKWYEFKPSKEEIEVGGNINKTKEISNIISYLKQMDLIFPVLHGLYGEDGTIQGMLELLKIPYVGCGVLGSSLGMDKVYTKIIFEKAGLNQAKYEYIKSFGNKYIYIDKNFNEKTLQLNEIIQIIEENLKYPLFIKPSNSGSSVGITKADNKDELEQAIKYAEKFDRKIIIEQGIKGKEVECAVLGNEEVIASCVGEVKSAEEFYSYEAKYQNADSKTEIPANISKSLSEQIRKQAIKAFKAIDGKGLSRVDFFIENGTNKIYINEINTMPGFTNISMYPKLFEETGIDYKKLLNDIINLAITNK